MANHIRLDGTCRYAIRFLPEAYLYAMRQRKVLDDNEWAGWLQWMKYAFHRGT